MLQLRVFFLLLFCLATIPTIAQVQEVHGTVRDAETREKLPFVSIAANQGETGTTTNLEGQFRLRHTRPITSLRFSYVGYMPQLIQPDSTGKIDVYLQPSAAQLHEVIVRAGVNPAHRIIELATRNRERNRPENIPAYTYRTYNKFILTATDPRNLNLSDTTFIVEAKDSSYYKMKKILEKQHLFLMESVTNFAYLKPNHTQETIVATRVSGLQQPSFGIVAAEARDFSVYADMPIFFGKNYLSPLSPGSTRKYDFILQETVVSGQDSVFIISFAPLKGRNFNGLKGLLYINSDGWAVQNIIAESASDAKSGIKLQQQFSKVQGRWFPTELDVEITIPQIEMKGHQPYGRIRTYITNINLSPDLKKSDFGAIALSQSPLANKQPEYIWQQYRHDSLDTFEQRTYTVIDSVGKAQNLDRSIRIMEYLITKKLPIGPISLDLNRLLHVSDFEGVRLGIGAHTNEQLLDWFSIGGYWGYGFKDDEQKYGADAIFTLHKPSNLKLQAAYWEDVLEPGGRRLPFRETNLFSDLRQPLLPYLDYTTHQHVSLSGRLGRYLQLHTQLQQEERRPTLFAAFDQPQAIYTITEAKAGLRFAYGEQLMQLFNQTMATPGKYPVLWLQYTRGLDGVLNGNYSYNKYDLRLEGSLLHRTFGKSNFTLAAGLVTGDVPFVNLYNGYGSYSDEYEVYSGEGFETMAPYEFFSDKFTALFLQQDLGKRLLRTKFFKPDVVLVTNIGYGNLKQELPELILPQVKTMEKGFFESGLMLNNVISSAFSGIGVGVFYRYGAYELPKRKDNLKFKLTATIAF
ncbi:carboxypeptidase-like regulatory domain-containing protein [Pontibacter sp. BT310]|uniref:DUF5686 and carboxypeptidase regulatory-like domain-containing protein n=1 Tax=Pontibacter populi TaxID=890055 RepID=A0ABS6XB07_9BACT|nr:MULTISPECIES: DUF5686 and carboxypeptidase-like regulatory domain-containing protein [Pontibacter]MBJ6117801.1 carboxypeptidase-like regulatory domain-containing protein [Pontibacter sp. BT310]MBR0570227.1 carboxypeptidase-like regulatory domain-containing protein [Microvirga sp. STS03]MBW3364653.1 DUF5686 and carboxypeptidase regulatory-like domain-containing protein [Pontibacter populi]